MLESINMSKWSNPQGIHLQNTETAQEALYKNNNKTKNKLKN